MRQNMKKSIIMTIIYCMGFGGLTLFIGTLYPYKNNYGMSETINSGQKALIASVSNSTDPDANTKPDNDSSLTNNESGSAPASTATPTPTPTPGPTLVPEPLPIYDLIVGGYPEIDKFFNDYYVAWNSCDYTLLKTLYTDNDNIIPLANLEKETRFIDDIRDTTYYIKKSYEDGTYIVYVYYEIKYVNIKTSLPRMDKFYLITDQDGNYKIYNSEMDEPLQSYLEERDQDDIIKDLIEDTNKNAKAALEKDYDLRVYVEALYSY